MFFKNLKKLFARSQIKDGKPEQKTIFPASSISFKGRKSSCDTVQGYFESFISSKSSDTVNRLFVGQLNKIYPECNLVIDGENCGQIHSIGYTFDDTMVVLRTAEGCYNVARS